MRRLQSVGDLQCDARRAFFRLRTMQVGAIDELEHEVVGSDVVNLTNVRMIQGRHGTRFLLESPAPVGVGGERFRQHLESDVAVQPCVPSAVDVAHPTRAEARDDFVGSETCARRQRHVPGLCFARAWQRVRQRRNHSRWGGPPRPPVEPCSARAS